jgi:uncharacterized ion transporter superfamily protein YfcC
MTGIAIIGPGRTIASLKQDQRQSQNQHQHQCQGMKVKPACIALLWAGWCSRNQAVERLFVPSPKGMACMAIVILAPLGD